MYLKIYIRPKRKNVYIITIPFYKMKKWVKLSLLCAIILVNILLAYQPHFNYSYPLLTDEYNHIAFAKYIVNEHKLPFTNPYLAYPEKLTNLESGFHFFLALLFSIIPGEPILYYKYFIIIFMIFNSLLLFYLVMLWFKSYYTALLSVLFYGAIKSTGDLLVHNYFLPLTMGITLLLLSFIFFYKWENTAGWKNRYLVCLVVISLITIITYPPTLTFFAGILFLYILFMSHNIHEKFNLKKRHFLIYFAVISAIIIIISLILMTYLNLTKFVIFPDTWTPVKAKYSPIFFFGVISSAFAFFGLISIIKEKKIILCWFIFSLIQIYLYYIFKFNILVPFARLFAFYLIGLSILAGIGVVYIYKIINNYPNKSKKIRDIGYIKIITIIIILILILVNYYFIIKNPLNPKYIITDETYDIIKFLNNNYKEDVIILSTGLITHAIYPATGQHVLGMINANLGGGFQKEVNQFLNAVCKEKNNMLKNGYFPALEANNLSDTKTLILSKSEFNCSFLNSVYNKTYYVYEIDKEKLGN